MAISVEDVGDGNPTIVLGDRFDFESVFNFRECYESLDNKKIKVITIDFSNTRGIDSSALGMLMNARKFFDQKNVKIRIINANDKIMKVFNISRFDKKFDIS